MNRMLLRSNKRRLVKKHFKKTGNVPAVCMGKKNGLWWYKVVMPVNVPIKERGMEA